jgi:hypothetical protein
LETANRLEPGSVAVDALAGALDRAGDRKRSRPGVLVTVEYRIDPADRDALARLEHGRRRDGAYAWGVFEDAAQEGRIIETFLIESWMEHLRQHERVTGRSPHPGGGAPLRPIR